MTVRNSIDKAPFYMLLQVIKIRYCFYFTNFN
ncbi:hypothetical protein M071_1948, partial [Bacteroides fragilis str. Ds-233]